MNKRQLVSSTAGKIIKILNDYVLSVATLKANPEILIDNLRDVINDYDRKINEVEEEKVA
jgi:hypothetical protein